MGELPGRWQRMRYGIAATMFAFMAAVAMAPRTAYAEPVTLTSEIHYFYSTSDPSENWSGNHEETYSFAIDAPSTVSISVYSSTNSDYQPSNISCEVFQSNVGTPPISIDKAQMSVDNTSNSMYMRLAMPKGIYSMKVTREAASGVESYMSISASAYAFYAGTDYQVPVPNNTSIEKAAPITLDKTTAGTLTNYYGSTYLGEQTVERYFSFTLSEPTNVKFFSYPYSYEAQLSLVRADGSVIKSAKSPYNAGQDYYETFDLDCGKLDKGTHYIRLNTSPTPSSHHNPLEMEFTLKVKTGHEMYRMYNPNSGEHLYTANQTERDTMVRNGWNYEGAMWIAPLKSSYPVYRLYNGNNGDHHYTTSLNEYNTLEDAGWTQEDVAFYSFDDPNAHMGFHGVMVNRFFNPNNTGAGAHHYSTSNAGDSSHEFDALLDAGWRYEGVGWTGVNWKYSW